MPENYPAPLGLDHLDICQKIEPRLSKHHHACLRVLAKRGYGTNPTDVARYLITREIDDLKRSNVLKPEDIAEEEAAKE